MRGKSFLIWWAVLLCSFAGRAAGAEDRPLPLVGRIAALDGAVTLRAAGGEWADSGINAPIAAGMSVRTAGEGRAELRVGPATIALAPGTELDVAQLDAAGTQLVLRRGRLGVRLSQLDPARSIEIDIARGGVWLLVPGDYDIGAGDRGAPSRVAVLDGRARVVGKGLDTVITTGSANLLTGDDPVIATLAAAGADEFVGWWRAAAGPDTEPAALHHVAATMTGYEALDANGSWETVAGHGAVWFPQAGPDEWAPYRNGHWRWIAPWGWSWIDDQPWAFAPTHYGRWMRFDEADALAPSATGTRWGWIPGRRVAEPLYAPAMVAFLGTAGVGISYADAVGPAVAWFALAPGEAYWPGYTSDPDTIRRLNEATLPKGTAIAAASSGEPPAAIVNGDYRNRRYANVVPRSVFTGGRPIAPALLQLPARRLDSAPLLAGALQLGPPTAPTRIATALAARPKLARAMATLQRILAPQRHFVGARTVTRVVATSPHARKRHLGIRAGRAAPALAARPARAPTRLRLAADAHRTTLR